ncbi:MAG: bifunctional adenosylcobinamide kinase/adenosylcobinamide-phosphate guanylyltransferase [Mastigocoleus sp.]
MSKVILVTGPARSGKSEWAENLAAQSHKPVIYIATAPIDPSDKEWQQRIQKHQQRRPKEWTTLEIPSKLSVALADANPNNCVLVDSLGTWVANLLEESDDTWNKILEEFIETTKLVAADIIFVAEEAGWGVIPAYPVGRIFRDRLGSVVRQLGVVSDDVYMVAGGHVLNLSLLGYPLPTPKS